MKPHGSSGIKKCKKGAVCFGMFLSWSFFPRAPAKGSAHTLTFSDLHLHTLTSADLHLHTFTSADPHLHICRSTSSHPHICRSILGSEPRTSCTLSENHATRPNSQLPRLCVRTIRTVTSNFSLSALNNESSGLCQCTCSTTTRKGSSASQPGKHQSFVD